MTTNIKQNLKKLRDIETAQLNEGVIDLVKPIAQAGARGVKKLLGKAEQPPRSRIEPSMATDDAPVVWRNPRTGEITSTPPGKGVSSTTQAVDPYIERLGQRLRQLDAEEEAARAASRERTQAAIQQVRDEELAKKAKELADKAALEKELSKAHLIAKAKHYGKEAAGLGAVGTLGYGALDPEGFKRNIKDPVVKAGQAIYDPTEKIVNAILDKRKDSDAAPVKEAKLDPSNPNNYEKVGNKYALKGGGTSDLIDPDQFKQIRKTWNLQTGQTADTLTGRLLRSLWRNKWTALPAAAVGAYFTPGGKELVDTLRSTGEKLQQPVKPESPGAAPSSTPSSTSTSSSPPVSTTQTSTSTDPDDRERIERAARARAEQERAEAEADARRRRYADEPIQRESKYYSSTKYLKDYKRYIENL